MNESKILLNEIKLFFQKFDMEIIVLILMRLITQK